MAHQSHRRSHSQTDNELWFNRPASARQHHDRDSTIGLSAYQATSHCISTRSTHTAAPSRKPAVSSSHLNKPLPPSPSSSEKKSRKSTAWRDLLRREPSRRPDSTHLQPEPYQSRERRSANLSVDTGSHHRHGYSHSMPSSPYIFSQSHPDDAAHVPRAHSSASDYLDCDATQYQPYSIPPENQASRTQNTHSVSANPQRETTPPRSRTLPDSPLSPTRENASSRPRPHTTCLSPTEPFTDMSQFHLFAEAMTGLPSDFEALSPTGPPQLQGSLFARRNGNDSIPLPVQHAHSSPSTPPSLQLQRELRDDWQNFEPPPFISSQVAPVFDVSPIIPISPLESYSPQWQPQPPTRMDSITAELELLGLNDTRGPEDELPDYQQSQAEMAEQKRKEASARARELEARWRGIQR